MNYSLAQPLTAGITGIIGARPRLNSIDLLRGLVLIVMALDHTRDFLGGSGLNPRDVTQPAMFLTRWITDFCAPIFMLLAGVSAFLYGARGRTTGEISRFLLTRGIWLIAIEFTVVQFGWIYAVRLDFFIMQVIFALGASMVVLAALVHLPRRAIAAIAVIMIAGHNLLDGVQAAQFGAWSWVWTILHQPAMLTFSGGTRLYVIYALIPWVGVMAAGYALGPLFKADRSTRLRWLVLLGAGATAGFVLLRATNLYGDPQPWIGYDSVLTTVLSFINVEKYPPSLLYVLMTVGPGLLLLAAFERAAGRIADTVITYGRVPFAYYILHIYLIHVLAIIYAWVAVGDASGLFRDWPLDKPPGYGLGLAGIYAVWIFVVVTMYPVCRWFAALKQRRDDWWLRALVHGSLAVVL